MKKFIAYILITLFACMLIWLCIPKSCEPIGKYEQLESNSKSSLMRDSIKTSHYLIFKKTNDSLISELKKRDYIHKSKIEPLSAKYHALRATIKHIQILKIDSSKNYEVPDHLKGWIEMERNTFINSGTMCDSLLMYLEAESAIKDSIIYMKDVNISELIKKVNSGEIAKSDLVDLVDELKKRLKKAKSDNLKLKILLIIDTLAHFLH